MSRSEVYDVIVIGAGSVGVPTAWALAARGVRTLVLDRFASPGQGSNKAAIGGIRATHSDPAKIRLGQRSLAIAATWMDTHGHDIEWTTGGYTFVAYGEREEKALKTLLEVQKKHGLNIDWLTAAELLNVVPSLNPEKLLGGTFSPQDGHCSTLRFSHALHDVAEQHGAEFRFNEPVLSIDLQGDVIRGVVTTQGTYAAPVVINAAGPWAKEIGALVDIDHPVMPDSHEAGITEPVARFLGPMLVDTRPETGSSNYYFYQLATGQIVFCITPSPNLWGTDRHETSTFLPMVARRMINLVPRLQNIRVRRTWRGLYPMTPDGSPLVGWSREIEGYLIAIGMCGQGFMLGPGLGELLARMIVDSELCTDDRQVLDILSPYRTFASQETLQ